MNLVPQQLNKQQIQLQFDGFLIRLQQELVWQVAHPRHPQVGSCGFAVFLMVTRPPVPFKLNGYSQKVWKVLCIGRE